MTTFRKTAIACALTAALGGVATTAGAVSLAGDGVGQVLIFPYYTVRNGWNSLFNITNTSDSTVALKVRFKEALNSRDVMDFNVVMSPHDSWTGWLTESGGTPVFKTDDQSCVVPTSVMTSGATFNAIAYNAPTDGGPTGTDRALEGYVVVTEMGATTDTQSVGPTSAVPDAVYYSNHATQNCSTVDAAFVPGSGASLGTPPGTTPAGTDVGGNPAAAWEFGPPVNALKGNFSLVSPTMGIAAGGTATTLANFFLGAPTGPGPGPGIDGFNNLVTAQASPFFLRPTLDNALPAQSLVVQDTDLTAPTPTPDIFTDTWNRGVDAVSAVLMRTHVYNEWSTNLSTGAATNWVVTFPTKSYYVDQGTGTSQLYAALNPSLPGATGAPAAGADLWRAPIPPFAQAFDGTSCNAVTFTLWDREEGSTVTTGTSVSPAPTIPPASLCFETNVVSFGDTTNLLGSGVAQSINTGLLTSGASFGWLDIDLTTDPAAQGLFGTGATGGPGCGGAPTGDAPGATSASADNNNYGGACSEPYYGLPVTGFMLKSRDFGDPTKNYGNISDHAYRRQIGSLPPA